MKYIVLLCDGMADRPIPQLGNKTPMEVAHKPNMDSLASRGLCGTACTIPEGMHPQSDIANLAVMGYDPAIYYRGRSPLEAVSMGIDLGPKDIAIRCNISTVSDEEDYQDKTMIDYSSDEISTEEARELVEYVARHLNTDDMKLYTGISYRHCLVIKDAQVGTDLTPPHDITGKPVRGCLPKGRYGERLTKFMVESHELLKNHPVNLARIAKGENPANTCWFWGEGTKPALAPFEELYGLKGGVVCAVDLIKGLGICAGMEVPYVEGATGAKRTDFAAKGRKALELLKSDVDFVYIHVEAPDESGHAGDIQCKIDAIEAIDKYILGYLEEGLREAGEDYAIMLLPDHPTPIEIRTHSTDPVPFVLYRSDAERQGPAVYTEASAASAGLHIEEGHTLMKKFTGLDF
ncbi:MAG: cofactor-independent phosphoglycerate mutase [Clostridia bacterium]|nr:cofactor-independent phosphoglycerate mutase [Clostridia bacterium]